MKISEPDVILEQKFQCDSKTVWAALTDVVQMRKWFFENIPEFKAEVGFETTFEVNTGERVFPHRWKIVEVLPLKKIVYHWSYDSYDGEALVYFELSEFDGNTLLKLTNRVTKDFSDEIPEFKRESCVGGWEYFIKQKLAEYLKNKTA